MTRWLARGEVELPGHLDWLSDLEHQQVQGLRFTKRRREYLTRRWTAKHAVAAELGLADHPAALAAIEVRHHDSGAPWAAVDGRPASLDISLTDRAGWAVCLVRVDAPPGSLGVDLELVEPRSAGFVADFLTPAEQGFVSGRSTAEARDLAANLVWSAKEAALKVLGVGLRADTRTVEVSVDHDVGPDGWSALRVSHHDGTVFPGWWRREGSFVLTVAGRAPLPPPERLPASADLAAAVPWHSWVDQPLV
jgi:4'-phosphopantetheinyl transferase